jgi:parallel beta-helix repeat protein
MGMGTTALIMEFMLADVTIDGGSYYNNAGHGVHVYASSQSSATNNTVVKNIRAYGNGSFGVGLYSGSNLRAYNNLVYGNGISVNGSGGIAARNGASSAKLCNNTVYNNGGFGIYVTGNPATVKNNIAFLNSTAVSATSSSSVSNNLTTNPSFVNASASNFYLLSSSPAINKGAVMSEVTRDFVGTLRPQGTSHDIGAYEYKLSSPTSLTVVGD